jgi:hypothetical protein
MKIFSFILLVANFAICIVPSHGAVTRQFHEKTAKALLDPALRIASRQKIELKIDEPSSRLKERSFVMVEERRDAQLVSISQVHSLDEYLSLQKKEILRETWIDFLHKSWGHDSTYTVKEGVYIDIPVKFPPAIKGIIGEGASLNIRGSQEINFGVRKSFFLERVDTETSRESPLPELLMQQRLNVKLDGTVGQKVHVLVDHDSERLSQLDNRIRLQYIGDEDEVIQKIEAGHTSLALPGGTRLIGAPPKHEGLFGIQTQAKVGPVDFTAIASRDQGEAESFRISGGAKLDTVKIPDHQYIPNRFFIIEEDPQYTILDVKVFKDDGIGTNNSATGAFVGNAEFIAQGDTEKYVGWFDWQPVSEQFYIDFKEVNQIHLSSSLGRNEVLAVSYIRTAASDTDTVGVFLDDYTPKDTFDLKLIRPQNPVPEDLTWDLNLKNVYSLGNVEPEDLNLRIFLRNPAGGFDLDIDPTSNKTFLNLLGLDREGTPPETLPDGRVDDEFIDESRGLLFFPSAFPFADTALTYPDSIIYDTANVVNHQYLYYLQFVAERSQTTFDLGKADILEGSEVVRLNGRVLNRDSDYRIDYSFGEIELIGQAATEGALPDANVEIDFQYAPFFSLTSKSLIGMRGDYAFSHGRIGSSWMFRSEGAPERVRQRLGEESTRILVGEVDGQFSLQPALFTRLADALPLVETEAPSTLTLTADAAASIPNPSVTGEGYIDDMEGNLLAYDLGIQRISWFFGSIPEGKRTDSLGYLQWYNPWQRVPLKDLELNPPEHRENEKRDFLNLVFHPLNNDSTSWGSISRAISLVDAQDFSQHKFLELWVKGDAGVLHVDMGEGIPEDAFWRHKSVNDSIRGVFNSLDTEDKNENSTLDADEDLGVDQAAGVDGEGALNDWGTDDYFYDRDGDPDNYTQINGTEGNNRLDTEDLDRDLNLDADKSFFSFTIDLTDPGNDFIEIDRLNETGWRLYRITLDDNSIGEVGTPDWQVIKYVRLWVDGFSQVDTIGIASLDIIGNRWREGEITPLTNEWKRSDFIDTTDAMSKVEFKIETKNNERDPDYTPPFEPRRDAFGRPEREGSLVLEYKNLPPNSRGYAFFQFTREQDFTLYKTISFYVHGPVSGNPSFSFRIGDFDRRNYYEYKMTNLGDQWYELNIPLDEFTQVRIGNPSLLRILRMELAVENPGKFPDSGEVWINEIRLTDPRRDPGTSFNLGLSSTFGDLMNWDLSFNREDDEYRTLNRKHPTNRISSTIGTRSKINLNKFLPDRWGVGMPLSLSYSRGLLLPKYKTGTDILLQGAEKTKERTLTIDQSANLSLRKQTASENSLARILLDPFKISTSIVERKSTSPTHLDTTRTTTGSISYGYSPSLPTLKPANGLEFAYFPDNINFSSGYSRARHASISLAQTDTTTRTKTIDLREGMTASGSGGLKPFKITSNVYSLQSNINYAIDFDRDLNHPLNKKLGGINIGEEVGRRQRVQGTFNSNILNLVDPSFNYSTRYDENHGQDIGGLDRDLRDVGNTNTGDIRSSFNLTQFLGYFISENDTSEIQAGSPKWILKGFQSVVGKLTPPQGGFSRTRQSTFSWLKGRPDFSYQLGFSRDIGDVDQDTLTNRRDIASTQNSYELRSGIGLGSITFNFALRGGNYEGGHEGQKNWSENLTWPILDLSISGLERRLAMKRVLQTASFRTSFSTDSEKRGNFQDEVRQDPEHLSRTWKLSPSLQATWQKGITTSISTDFNKHRNESPRSLSHTKGNSQSYNLTVGYGLRSPTGIMIPLFGRVRFKSTLDLKLSTQLTQSLEKSFRADEEPIINQHASTLTVTPSARYSFSQSLTGTLELGFKESNNKRLGHTNRDFSLNFSILFKF